MKASRKISLVGGYINVTYESTLTDTSPIFQSPSLATGDYYYDVIGVSVEMTSVLILQSESAIDTYAYLYNASFDPIVPYQNIYTSDDQSGGDGQFSISRNLIADQQYYLVVSTKVPETTGPFKVIASGQASADLTPISRRFSQWNSIASNRMILEPPSVTTNYISPWLINNSTFELSPIAEELSLFALLQIIPKTPGVYIFQSLGNVSTNGYMYVPAFDASSPFLNLKKYDLQSHLHEEFRLSYVLEVNVLYYLLTTTYFSNEPEPLTVSIRGPASVDVVAVVLSQIY